MLRNFKTEGHALVYMVECTMATLEHNRSIKRTPQSEIRRLESIIDVGLQQCRRYGLKEDAHKARCGRVERWLVENEVKSP